MASLFDELKRRNVVRVGIAYVAAAWLILQVVDLVIESVSAPPWVMQMILVLTALGFPVAMAFAWAFEITPEGVKREKEIDREKSIAPQTGRRLDRLIIVVLVLAVGVLLTDRFSTPDSANEAQRSASTAEQAPATPAITSDSLSVAVLPFVNRSNAESDEFFVDGIHDDILTQLAKISSLKVISRTSVLQYRDTQKTMRVIGEELDVGTIMEGSVQRAGDRVRINVQLIDAVTDEHIWAEVYDRGLTAANIFEIQTEIATAIAGALRTNLTEQEEQRLALTPTENLAAYEAYLLGRQWMTRRTKHALSEAETHFERAIELDPDFALAYVGMADTILLQFDYAGKSPLVVSREARPFITRALELDDQSGEAYISLAAIEEYAGNYGAAAINYERGLELAPNYAQGLMWYGLHLWSVLGQPELSLQVFLEAHDKDPHSAIVYANIAVALEALGRFDEASAAIRKITEIDPDFVYGFSFSAYNRWGVDGRLDLAAEWFFRHLASDKNNETSLAGLARLYADLGDDQTAWCWMDTAIEFYPDSAFTIPVRASLYAFRGDKLAASQFGRRTPPNIYERAYWAIPMAISKGFALESGKAAEIRNFYLTYFPEFRTIDSLQINHANYFSAVDFADVLIAYGDSERALKLLSLVE
ncbi:MAG: TolB-like protein, partial [Woeseiaceae bacterium]